MDNQEITPIEDLMKFCQEGAKTLIQYIKRGEYEKDTELSFYGAANPKTEEERNVCRDQVSQMTFHYVREGLTEEERRHLLDKYEPMCRSVSRPNETILCMGYLHKSKKKAFKQYIKKTNGEIGTVCFNCRKFAEKYSKCGNCKKAVYCGKECQVAHWKEHKKCCVKKE